MAILSDEEVARRAAEIDWILSDVDGVLTDNGLYYDRRGQRLMRFNARDGLAVHLAHRAGIKIGLLTGRSSAALDRRASELGIDTVIAGSRDKAADFATFLSEVNLAPRRVAYLGDDLPDLTVLGRCGLAFAPADAAEEVRSVAHLVLAARGGRGALREAVEVVLKRRGDWEKTLSPFTFDA